MKLIGGGMMTDMPVMFAVIITLFASAMWGSWMQIIKLCPDYPIHGVVITIYSVSFIALSCAAAIGRRIFFPEGLINFISDNIAVIFQIALGGGAAALGVLVSLKLMRNSGLVVGTAVSGAAGSITGVLIAVAKEGLPDVPYAGAALILCTAIIVSAGILCSLASILNKDVKKRKKENILVENVVLLILFIILSNGYIYGTSSGTNVGMNPFLICLCLSFGAFAVTLMFSGTMLTLKHEWLKALCMGESKRPLAYGAVAAVCHYGGNLLSIICMPVLSATLSFLIGRSANIWTFIFGIHLGEFSGASKRVRSLLVSGMLCYFIGIFLIALWFY